LKYVKLMSFYSTCWGKWITFK